MKAIVMRSGRKLRVIPKPRFFGYPNQKNIRPVMNRIFRTGIIFSICLGVRYVTRINWDTSDITNCSKELRNIFFADWVRCSCPEVGLTAGEFSRLEMT